MWPGVLGLHFLQCNRIGYRHWSLSQCSCHSITFQKTFLPVRSWVTEIQGSCLEESIRGSMAPVFNASRCVRTFQVHLMILSHPCGHDVGKWGAAVEDGIFAMDIVKKSTHAVINKIRPLIFWYVFVSINYMNASWYWWDWGSVYDFFATIKEIWSQNFST